MNYKLPPLPYAESDLAPVLSSVQISRHYNGHQAHYVKQLNMMAEVRELPSKTPLETVISRGAEALWATIEMGPRTETGSVVTLEPELSASNTLYNLSSQVYAHTFYFRSMCRGGGGLPHGRVRQLIIESFGSYNGFYQRFIDCTVSLFGSGWVWLCEREGRVYIVRCLNAANPLPHGFRPLIALDVWEHAYYLDYKESRLDYVLAFFESLVDWSFAEANLLVGSRSR